MCSRPPAARHSKQAWNEQRHRGQIPLRHHEGPAGAGPQRLGVSQRRNRSCSRQHNRVNHPQGCARLRATVGPSANLTTRPGGTSSSPPGGCRTGFARTGSPRGGRQPAPGADPGSRTSPTHSAAACRPSAVSGQPVLLSAHANENVSGTGHSIDIIDATTNAVVASCASGSSCSTRVSNSAGSHTYQAIIGTPTGRNAQASSPIITVTWVPAALTLSASDSSPKAGQGILLTASANEDVAATPWVILIVDLTTGKIVASCGAGKRCSEWVSHASGRHTYQALIAKPGGSQVQASSSTLTVAWP